MRRLRFKVALCVLLTTSLVSLSSMAQTREAKEGATKAPAESKAPANKTQAQNPKTATSSTSPTKPAATKKNSQTAKPQDEVFIPSEEISEDFAVSFPVDI